MQGKFFFLPNDRKCHYHTGRLGKYCPQSRPCRRHLKSSDKKEIQQNIQHSAQHHLKSRRRRQAGAAQHIAGGEGIEAAHLAAFLHDTGGHTADEGSAVLGLMLLGGQYRQVDVVDLTEAFGDETDGVVVVLGHHGDDVQVHRRRHDHTVVVVGVVAADLGTAGGGVQAHIAVGAELFLKIFDGFDITLPLGRNDRRVIRVELGKRGVIGAVSDLLFQNAGNSHDRNTLPF